MTTNNKSLQKVASTVLAAEPDYVHDPEHRNRPKGGGWRKTDKGWSKADSPESGSDSSDSGNTPEMNEGIKNMEIARIRKLSKSEDVVERQQAISSLTPQDVWEKLVDDEDWQVRLGVATSPYAPENVLQKLSNDHTSMYGAFIRHYVARQCKDPETIEKLSKDTDFFVREGAAMNPNAPDEILRTLAEDTIPRTSEAALKNLNSRKSTSDSK